MNEYAIPGSSPISRIELISRLETEIRTLKQEVSNYYTKEKAAVGGDAVPLRQQIEKMEKDKMTQKVIMEADFAALRQQIGEMEKDKINRDAEHAKERAIMEAALVALEQQNCNMKKDKACCDAGHARRSVAAGH